MSAEAPTEIIVPTQLDAPREIIEVGLDELADQVVNREAFPKAWQTVRNLYALQLSYERELMRLTREKKVLNQAISNALERYGQD